MTRCQNASSDCAILTISLKRKVEQQGSQTTRAVRFIREEFDVQAGRICLLKNIIFS